MCRKHSGNDNKNRMMSYVVMISKKRRRILMFEILPVEIVQVSAFQPC